MTHRCVACRGIGTVFDRQYLLVTCPYCKGSKVEMRAHVLATLPPHPMSKRALRRLRRQLRGEVRKAVGEAQMFAAMYYSKLREMQSLSAERDYWHRKYEEERRLRASMCHGVFLLPG